MVAFNESGKYRRVLCTTFNLEAVTQFNVDDSVNHGDPKDVWSEDKGLSLQSDDNGAVERDTRTAHQRTVEEGDMENSLRA